MNVNLIYNFGFGLLFLLVSGYFYDLVCREQYVDFTYYSFDGKEKVYTYHYVIFFVSNILSLLFLSSSAVLLAYMFVQLAIIIISLLKIGKSNEKPIYIIDTLSMCFFITLVVLKFFFNAI